jgi:hypothetical protein
MGQDFQRMIDGAHTPTEEEITDFIGEPARGAWAELRRFLEEHYDIVPEMVFGGARKLESEKALSTPNELSPKMYKMIENTKQLHDGRWLWIRLLTASAADDVKKLLPIKRKPKKAV